MASDSVVRSMIDTISSMLLIIRQSRGLGVTTECW
jgi:hypothetical protein